MRVPGFARLYAGLLLGRMGGSMVFVALVLFVLQRYHSPQLAGATAFMAALPGIVVSPVAGALLDRYGRARLVTLDYALAAVALGSIAGLSALHLLPAPVLLAIVAVASLTNPLSWAGARSLFPILAPRHLWEHANGLDSSGHVIATLIASPLAGTLVAFVGGEWALAVAILPFANNLGVVAVAVTLLGLATGPFDIGLFTLRQRRTDPAWFGRAFAVSMSLNSLGNPIGSALAGPLIALSVNAALWTAAAACFAAALLPLLTIPRGGGVAVSASGSEA